jgi:hypothetical protein
VVQLETQYAKCGPVSIAYQVVGDGPTDLILVPGFVSHVEVASGGSAASAFSEPAGLVLAADHVRQAWHEHVGSGH